MRLATPVHGGQRSGSEVVELGYHHIVWVRAGPGFMNIIIYQAVCVIYI